MPDLDNHSARRRSVRRSRSRWSLRRWQFPWRWAVVAVLLLAVVSGPALLTGARLVNATSPSPESRSDQADELLTRAVAAAGQPHQGLAESQGTLGLPDLNELGDTARLLGGSTRTRVWWAGQQSWRVDTLTLAGEIGDYATADGLVTWDYEGSRLTTVLGDPQVRLPRAVDLLPPRLLQRLLSQLGPEDTVSLLPDRVVADEVSLGFQVRPGDPNSSLSVVRVWVRPSGFPVAMEIIDRTDRSVLSSRYLQLSIDPPDPERMIPPDPTGAEQVSTPAPDITSRLTQPTSRRPLPDTLAGVRASTELTAGASTYGQGLVRFVVLPAPARLTSRLQEATAGGQPVEVTGGRATVLRTSGLNAVAVLSDSGRRSYLLAGLVTPDLLVAAAEQLMTQPSRRTTP